MNGSKYTTSIIAAVALAAMAGIPAAADCLTLGLVGDNIDLSRDLTTQRRSSCVSYNSVDNEYMVVWFDTRNPGNNDVFGQRVSAGGALAGTNFPIIEFADAQVDPFISHNSTNNEYLVAWRTQQSGSFNKSRGRRVAADGSLIGGDFFIGNGHEISIAYNLAANEFLLSGRSPGIRGRRISNTGQLLGGEITIASVGAPAPNGQVAYDSSRNRFLATWRNQSNQNLQGQLVTAAGALFGGPILISPDFPESGRAASVVYDPDNDRYLVVFARYQDTVVRGQFISPDGLLIGGDFSIAAGLSGRTDPNAAYSSDLEAFVVVWRDGGDIVARAVAADGTVSNDLLTLASGTASGIPTIAYNEDTSEFLAAWTDTRNIGSGEEDIYAQLIAFACCDPCDANCDGVVDLSDVQPLVDALLGSPSGCSPCQADANGDGSLDGLDLQAFIGCLVGP